MNDNIQPLRRALAKSRAVAKKETAEADNLSRHLAKLIKAEMKQNEITLKRLSELTKISMSQIVNWLCGSSMHCIPPDVITTLFNAAAKPTKPKKKRTL
jgi:hypothetical protein